GRRLQDHVGDGGDDRSIALAFGALAHPFRVDDELIPLHLALSERLPREEIAEVLVAAGTDQHRPEPGLPDAVSLPELERCRFEPLQQGWKSPGHAVVDAQFIDHGCLRASRRPTLTAGAGKAIGVLRHCRALPPKAGFTRFGPKPMPTPANPSCGANPLRSRKKSL